MARSRTGFSLVELLLVIGLIAAVIAIITVSMQRVRTAANRTDAVNSLRQMAAGYNAYMADNRHRLMPGYVNKELIQDGDVPLSARLYNGVTLNADNQPDAVSSYVWRLAPYLNHEWRVMFSDYRDAGTINMLVTETQNENYGPDSFPGSSLERGAPSMPSFGLNSIFIGGDTRHGGADVVCRNPITPCDGDEDEIHAATRFSEVRNPSRVVLFGSVARANPTIGDGEPTYAEPEWLSHELGYMELRPPFVLRDNQDVWTQRQWRIGMGGEVTRDVFGAFDDGAGLPILRWGGGALPVAHLDGSARAEDINVLASDMRRWSPFETGIDLPPVFIPDPVDF